MTEHSHQKKPAVRLKTHGDRAFPVAAPKLRPRHTMRQIAATCRGDKSPRLNCCCDKSLALSLSLRYVAQIQTSLNLCDRSQRQNSVAATMIFTCHTRRFVAATCRGDVSQRLVASCVSALWSDLPLETKLSPSVALLKSRLRSHPLELLLDYYFCY